MLPQPVHADLFMSQQPSYTSEPSTIHPSSSFVRQTTGTDELRNRGGNDYNTTPVHHPNICVPVQTTTTAPPINSLNFAPSPTHHMTTKAVPTQDVIPTGLDTSIHRSSSHAMKRVSTKVGLQYLNN